MQRVFLHPLPVRLWHWTNVLGFLALIATGLQIRYVGLVNVMSFETAVSLHNIVGFVVIANFFVCCCSICSRTRTGLTTPSSTRRSTFAGPSARRGITPTACFWAKLLS